MDALLARFKQWFDGKSAAQKWFIGLLAFSALATAALFSLTDSPSVANDPLGATPFYFLGAFVKTIVVLLLIVGCAILARRWTQHGAGAASNRQLRTLETLRLSPKQALHLVAVGDQTLLIGATDQAVALIAPIGGNPASPSNVDFGALIRSFDPATPPVNE